MENFNLLPSLLVLLVSCTISFLFAFFLGKLSRHKEITRFEKELMESNAELLRIKKENIILDKTIRNLTAGNSQRGVA